jgi:hypothetical protein
MSYGFIYQIYFDKVGQPERIYSKSALEFKDILMRLIERTGEMPEWIIRVYK